MTVYQNPVSPLVFFEIGRAPEGNGHPLIQQIKSELAGQRVEGIGLLDNDRALEIAFEQGRSLIIEPVERTPNLILTEGTDRTITACYEIKPKLEPHQRSLVPGEKYRTLPAGDRIKIAEYVESPALPSELPPEPRASNLYRVFVGLDWWSCREFEEKAKQRSEPPESLLEMVLTTAHSNVLSGRCTPTLHIPPRRPGKLPGRNELPFVLPYKLEELEELEAESRESVNEALHETFDRVVAIFELEKKAI